MAGSALSEGGTAEEDSARRGDGTAGRSHAPVDALRESERLYRAIAGSAPTIVWLDDTQGQCVYLNKTWSDFTGLPEADGLGEGWSSVVHPDDRAGFRAAFLAAVVGHEAFRSEYRMRRHDGQWRWVIDSATPILGADGAFQGHIGSVIDITERREVEAAFRENEEKLRLAVDATDLGLWDFDIASGALIWNDRLKALYGLSREAEVTYELYQAAILDVNLEGEMVYPLAERLIARRVPTIFATGYDVSTTLPDDLRAVPTLQKPVDLSVLVRRLLEATKRAE